MFFNVKISGAIYTGPNSSKFNHIIPLGRFRMTLMYFLVFPIYWIHRLKTVIIISVLHFKMDGRSGVSVLHVPCPLLNKGSAGCAWNIAVTLMVHHCYLCILFRLKQGLLINLPWPEKTVIAKHLNNVTSIKHDHHLYGEHAMSLIYQHNSFAVRSYEFKTTQEIDSTILQGV